MAAEEAEIDDEWEDARPEYHRVVKDLRFLNISIKTYEKKTGGGFPREEYFAFRIVSILTSEPLSMEETAATQTHDETKKQRHQVWRRYSEFEMLRNFLCTVYPYVVVPPLPEKTIKGSSGLLSKITFSGEDSEFLIKRQHALEIFLVRVSRHPVLSQSYWFHQFLQNIGWRESVQRTGYSAKSESLLTTLSLQLSKHKGDQRFQDVRDYAEEIESVFKSLLEIREKMNESVKAVYKIHSNYGRVFSEWSEMEDTIGTALQIAGGCMDSYAESVDMYLDEEELRYYMPLKEYLAYCGSLKAMVKRHDMLEKKVERAEITLSAKAEAKATIQREGLPSGVEEAGASAGSGSGSSGGRFSFRSLSNRLRRVDDSYESRISVATKELQEAEESVKISQKELQLFTTEALEEMMRFHKQKSADFRSILINFIQLQMHMHRKGMDTWERIKQGFSTM